MAKTGNENRHNQRGTQWVEVHTDLDPALAELLKGSGAKGAKHERLVHQLHIAADPLQGKANNTVRFLPGDAAAVAEDIALLLRQAREGGHAAADALADVAAQLGYREPGPAPAQAQAPALTRPAT
ncbi:MAG TPA: hypothetical protein VF070_13220 [Streptosporangiaceae bacterium]